MPGHAGAQDAVVHMDHDFRHGLVVLLSGRRLYHLNLGFLPRVGSFLPDCPNRRLPSLVIILILFASIQKLMICRAVFENHGGIVIRVIGMTAQGTTELFPVAALRIDMPAHRACLAGVIRFHFQKRHTVPVQFGHQLLL